MYLILCVLLVVLGLTMICKPGLMYELLESWKHNGASEPSRFYIWNIRFGGCVFALVGVVCGVILLVVR